MQRTIYVIMLFTTMLFSGLNIQLARSVFHTNREVGVDIGDWNRFGEIKANYTSNDPSPPVTMDPAVFDWQSIVMLVEDVSSKNITLKFTAILLNRTEQTYTSWVDVEMGHPTGYLGGAWFISSNLAPGDRIYFDGYNSQFEINGTTYLTFAEESREVVYLNYTIIHPSGEYTETSHMEYYWDRLTGMLCELKFAIDCTSESLGYTTLALFSVRLEQTNLWGPTLEGDLTHNGVVDVFDISQMAVLLGSKKGDPDWNTEADLAPPYSMIDLLDLVTCAYHYGETYP